MQSCNVATLSFCLFQSILGPAFHVDCLVWDMHSPTGSTTNNIRRQALTQCHRCHHDVGPPVQVKDGEGGEGRGGGVNNPVIVHELARINIDVHFFHRTGMHGLTLMRDHLVCVLMHVINLHSKNPDELSQVEVKRAWSGCLL